MSDLVEQVEQLRAGLVAVADPERRPAMEAYMRDQFVMLGVSSPARREAQKPFLAAARKATGEQVMQAAELLWAQPEREFQYVAADLLKRSGKRLGPEHLDRLKGLVQAKSWWDTVDTLASNPVGTVVQRHDLQSVMDVWIDDPDLWVARTAILHQLKYRDATDEARLFRYCERQAAHTDFFIRKAIGWALRQYGKTEPDAVRAFVAAHEHELSGLSKREALKGIA